MAKKLNTNKAISEVISNRFISHFKSDTWGNEIYIMGKKGEVFSRIYWYHDDNSTIYLAGLSVNEKERRKGFGKEMQELRESIGIRLGATTSCLWVEKNTWMHDWYKRRGYEDWKNYDEKENVVWMRKSLILNK